jgi:hypothetical protein
LGDRDPAAHLEARRILAAIGCAVQGRGSLNGAAIDLAEVVAAAALIREGAGD